MNEFVECKGCGFVLYARHGDEPLPRDRDTCPRCEGTDFRFTGE